MTALTTLFDAHLAAVCGLRVLDHIHTGGISPGATAEAVADILTRTREVTRRAFTDELV